MVCRGVASVRLIVAVCILAILVAGGSSGSTDILQFVVTDDSYIGYDGNGNVMMSPRMECDACLPEWTLADTVDGSITAFFHHQESDRLLVGTASGDIIEGTNAGIMGDPVPSGAGPVLSIDVDHESGVVLAGTMFGDVVALDEGVVTTIASPGGALDTIHSLGDGRILAGSSTLLELDMNGTLGDQWELGAYIISMERLNDGLVVATGNGMVTIPVDGSPKAHRNMTIPWASIIPPFTLPGTSSALVALQEGRDIEVRDLDTWQVLATRSFPGEITHIVRYGPTIRLMTDDGRMNTWDLSLTGTTVGGNENDPPTTVIRQLPTVSFTTETIGYHGSTFQEGDLDGGLALTGWATSTEGTITLVQVRVVTGADIWRFASNTDTWSYVVPRDELVDGTNTIQVRSYDGSYSMMETIAFTYVYSPLDARFIDGNVSIGISSGHTVPWDSDSERYHFTKDYDENIIVSYSLTNNGDRAGVIDIFLDYNGTEYRNRNVHGYLPFTVIIETGETLNGTTPFLLLSSGDFARTGQYSMLVRAEIRDGDMIFHQGYDVTLRNYEGGNGSTDDEPDGGSTPGFETVSSVIPAMTIALIITTISLRLRQKRERRRDDE